MSKRWWFKPKNTGGERLPVVDLSPYILDESTMPVRLPLQPRVVSEPVREPDELDELLADLDTDNEK